MLVAGIDVFGNQWHGLTAQEAGKHAKRRLAWTIARGSLGRSAPSFPLAPREQAFEPLMLAELLAHDVAQAVEDGTAQGSAPSLSWALLGVAGWALDVTRLKVSSFS